jgi:uncharacterized protein (TIGR03066 family)
MKMLRIVLLGCVAAGLAGVSASARAPAPPRKEAPYKEKIIGTWELTTSAEGVKPPLLQLTKDGKFKFSWKVPSGESFTLQGTYAVDGDKLALTGKGLDEKEHQETATISKLTDTELVIKFGKDDIKEFKKK